MLDDQQMSTPGGYYHRSDCAPIAVSLDLAQDLAVEDRAEFHASLAASSQRGGPHRLFVQCIGVGYLIAEKLGTHPGRGRSKALDRAASDVDATVSGVYINVTQDVRSLHRSTKCGHLLLVFGPSGLEEMCKHDPDRTTCALAIEFEIVFGVDNHARDVVSHPLAEFEKCLRG
jgi:hypothetical protein